MSAVKECVPLPRCVNVPSSELMGDIWTINLHIYSYIECTAFWNLISWRYQQYKSPLWHLNRNFLTSNLDYSKIISPHSSHKCRERWKTKWSCAVINVFQSVWLRLCTQMRDLTGIQILDFWFLTLSHYSNFVSQINRRLLSLYIINQKANRPAWERATILLSHTFLHSGVSV